MIRLKTLGADDMIFGLRLLGIGGLSCWRLLERVF